MIYVHTRELEADMIEKTIAKLSQLSRSELVKKWQEIFQLTPAPAARKEFLVKHLAWEIQAQEQGGYSSQTKKKLETLAKDLDQNQEIKDEKINALKQNALTIKPGTKLIREYQGKNHEVLVLENNYQYQNKVYRSLSSIANEITGTRWNGKIFFGLKKGK